MTKFPGFVQENRQEFPCTERRTTARYPCEVEEAWTAEDEDHHDRASARVRNISTDGLSLRLKRPFDLGTLLNIDLLDKQGAWHSKLVRVLNVHQSGNGDWILGCSFLVRLSRVELRALV
jgi:hypothetical protein